MVERAGGGVRIKRRYIINGGEWYERLRK